MRDVWLVLAALLVLCAPGVAQLTTMGVGAGFSAAGGGGGGNAVLYNSQNTAPAGGEALTSKTMTDMTVGSGVNRALILLVGFSTPFPSGFTATWDSGGSNQAMTSVLQYTGGTCCSLGVYALLNPVSGNKQLAMSWTGSREMDAMALDFSHVNQTGGATSFPHTASNDDNIAGSSNPATVTVTSSTNNYTVCVNITNWLFSPGTATKTELTNGLDNSLSASAYEWQRAAGAGSVTYGITISASGHAWTSGALDIAHD